MTENLFETMSRNFQAAFGYSNSGMYRASIPLYEKAIIEDKNNFAAINNIGVAKINVGIEDQKIALIEEGMENFKEAIRIAKDVYNYEDGYPIAEQNLIWAEGEIKNLKD